MASVALLVPGAIETRTGGYGYDREIERGLRAAGWDVRLVELDSSFPEPTAEALNHAAGVLAGLPDGSAVLVDGLALGAMPAQAERERERLRLVALVHHPLALETGIAPARAAALEASERRSLAAVRHVVVTSERTVGALEQYGVGRDRVTVIEPGTARAPLARGSKGGSGSGAVHVVSVAAIAPRKGHDILVRAVAKIARQPWRLTVVGSTDRDPRAVEELRRLVGTLGIAARVELAGELEGPALDAAYDGADVFALASRYEGYGMAVAEAIARGLPVVSTATGAIAELTGAGGMIVPPGDDDAFAEALSRVVSEKELRQKLAAGARDARERLTSWDRASRRMAEVVSVEFQR
jgi:glycosyltransferase involved in cell wall biosynthesis